MGKVSVPTGGWDPTMRTFTATQKTDFSAACSSEPTPWKEAKAFTNNGSTTVANHECGVVDYAITQ